MSVRDNLMINGNTDDEAAKILDALGDDNEDILKKLDSIQQSVLAGFAALHADSRIFIADGEFTVPEGIYEIEVFACAAGGVVYAGESVISHKIAVTPNEVIPIVVGDAQTEIGDYLYLNPANSSNEGNADCLGIGILLGINGSNGANKNISSAPKVPTVQGGSGGFGGAFGFGGGGGGAGGIYYYGSSYGSGGGGNAHTETHNVYINGILITFNGAEKGETGASPSSINADKSGGDGGNAGGFGAGAGTGGETGTGWSSSVDGKKVGSDGANGKGSQGLVIIKWGVEL